MRRSFDSVEVFFKFWDRTEPIRFWGGYGIVFVMFLYFPVRMLMG